MNVLLCWVPYLFDKQFISNIKKYVELKPLRSRIFDFIEKIVYTTVSYYDSYDYKLIFDKYDKKIYLYRDPLEAINSFHIILNYKGIASNIQFNPLFMKYFIKEHLQTYYLHLKTHLELMKKDLAINEIYDYDFLIQNYDDFKSLVYSLDQTKKEIHLLIKKEQISEVFNDKMREFIKIEWEKLNGNQQIW